MSKMYRFSANFLSIINYCQTPWTDQSCVLSQKIDPPWQVASWSFQSQTGPMNTFDLISNIFSKRETQHAQESSLHKKNSLRAREKQTADEGPAHAV